ncbi:MAG: tetratricopeptide repeat protein [Limisphaerales bacterium]
MATRQHSRFVHFVLPWMVATGALVLFLLTRHPWMSVASLPAVAKVAGWDWLPGQLGPAVWLLTAPIRLLAPAAQPAALNLLAAVCGTLALGLLAKCVVLLPHDRTREQRQREKSDFAFLSLPLAWVPPVVAALFAGLQITWWEHATAFTGEMVSLLLFAFCVFAILRFRVAAAEAADRWLLAVAFIAPFAAVGNWGMTGFLPLFLVAMIWVKGIRFFDGRFLTRAMLCAAAGLAFILFNPVVQKLGGNPASLFQLLRIELGLQKSIIAGFPKYLLLMFGLTSVLPLLVMGVRWASSFGDLSAAGSAVTNVMFRVIHAAFLVACVGVTFDPPFSPRVLGFGLPYLPLYFLGALSIGYFSGYLLLVLGEPSQSRTVRVSAGGEAAGRAAAWVLALVLVAGGIALGARNLPKLRAQNSPALRELAGRLADSLPAGGIAALSDDPGLLMLAAAATESRPAAVRPVFLDTRYLPLHAYQQHLARRHAGRWPELILEQLPDPLPDIALVQQVALLSASNRIFYLHPSFGYYFEAFHATPTGTVFELTLRHTNRPAPPLAPAVAAAQASWLQAREDAVRPEGAERMRVLRAPDAAYLVGIYGRALNTWGVLLQRTGNSAEAGRFFGAAARLDTNNFIAEANRVFNAGLQASTGTNPPVRLLGAGSLPLVFRDLRSFFLYSGPPDEPDHLFTFGAVMGDGGLVRQSAEAFARAAELRPDSLPVALALAGTQLRVGDPAVALRGVEEIRARFAATLSADQQDALSDIEALARLNLGDVRSAERTLRQVAAARPGDLAPLQTLVRVYVQASEFTNALAVLDQIIAGQPADMRPVVTRSAVQISMQDFAGAVLTLDPLLARQTNNIPALVNRALALSALKRNDDAARDYRALSELAPGLHDVWFHLGELDFQRREFAAARRNFERFLDKVPPGSDQARQARERLVEISKARAGG